MMQLGLLSSILSFAEIEDMLEITVRNGYECVEVACWPTGKAERRYAGVSQKIVPN